MQIQKGLVKYKDRNDIVCTYGITEEGSQYYFLDVPRLPNGNIIASTALVEAIDSSVVSSSIGVIDSKGKIVIPFANKMIKPIAKDILLVERAQPMTDSVLESIKLRTDPLAATKLVTIPTTIKDRLNSKMGVDGNFVFDDQFSEATICDMNGNNLVDDQYFSFISMSKDALYFSTNVLDSEIVSYSLFPQEIRDNNVEGNGNLIDDKALDVNNVDINKTTIDKAVNGDVDDKDISEKDDKVSQPSLGDVINKDLMMEDKLSNNLDDSMNKFDVSFVSNDKEESYQSPINISANEKVEDDNLVVPNVSESEQKVEQSSVDGIINMDNSEEVSSSEDMSTIEEEKNEEIKQPLFGELVNANNVNKEDDLPIKMNEVTSKFSVNDTVHNDVDEEHDDSEAGVIREKNDPLPLSNVINDIKEEEESEEDKNYPSTHYFDMRDDKEENDEGLLNLNLEVASSDVGRTSLNNNMEHFSEHDADVSGIGRDFSNNTERFLKHDVDSTVNNDIDDMDMDLDMDLDLHLDSVEDSNTYASSSNYTDYMSDYSGRYASVGGAKDSIIEDVAVTMSNLINLNRDQQKKINTCEEQIKQLSSSHKKIAQKARNQMREIDLLKTKLQNYESIVNKLEARNQVLDDRVHDQEKTISSQASELEELRPQVEGKEELVKLIVDAQNILGKDKVRV